LWSTNYFILRIHRYIQLCITSFRQVRFLFSRQPKDTHVLHNALVVFSGATNLMQFWLFWHFLLQKVNNWATKFVLICSKKTKTEMTQKKVAHDSPYYTLIFCTHNYNPPFYFCFLSLFFVSVFLSKGSAYCFNFTITVFCWIIAVPRLIASLK